MNEVSSSIPPSACFAPFKWQDCGRPPTPVMYYWKPGSRCEVGLWRGCLPNLNMFKDEYECVSTCIFSVRAGEEDFHKQNLLSGEIEYDGLDDMAEQSDVNDTEIQNGGDSTTTNSENATGADNAVSDNNTGDTTTGANTSDNATTIDAAAEGNTTDNATNDSNGTG
ncbi:hypothetical protein O0L34_g14056 [Tuta absoluta]|nr:hypothetical protein O0L34_g14056 [Tuta absoluta]